MPSIPERDDSFDAAVTFETIEHIDDDLNYLRELRRVLRPGGLLVLSTPNKAVTSPDGPPANPFHVREYTLSALVDLVAQSGFRDIEMTFSRTDGRTCSPWATARRPTFWSFGHARP